MITALDQHRVKTDIKNATKEVLYYCPVCNGEVVPRMGSVNMHHFAHKDLTECDKWADMSQWHSEWQDRFPLENREIVLSVNDQKHRADVKVDDLVIEFQHSPLSIDELKERIDFYTANNNKLIFVFDVREKAITPHKDNSSVYTWEHSSRSILFPNNKNYFVFLQLEDDLIVMVSQSKYLNGDKSIYGDDLYMQEPLTEWTLFVTEKAFGVNDFISFVLSPSNIKVLEELAHCRAKQRSERIQSNKELNDLRQLQRKNFGSIRSLEEEVKKQKASIEQKIKSAKQLENRNSELLKELNETKDKLREMERLYNEAITPDTVVVTKEVEVIKEVEKYIYRPIKHKEFLNEFLLEIGRYLSIAKTNKDREKVYPRLLFEKRMTQLAYKYCEEVNKEN